MVPKFTSKTDMIGFLRALPKNAAYKKMLKTDFNHDADDLPDWKAEFLWKYYVQGQYEGIKGTALKSYAILGAGKMQTRYHVDLREENKPAPIINAPKPTVTVRVSKDESGVITFNTKYQKYDGYVNGKVVSRAATIDKVKACLTSRYNVSQFSVKEL